MSLQSLINNYYFYQKYQWSATDFAALQSNILAQLALTGGGNQMILSGLQASPDGGLQVHIAPGVCINSSGYLMYIPTTQVVTMTSPVGNPSFNFIVARPLLVDNTQITNPLNPSGPTVPLLQQQSYQLQPLTGTPSSSPAFPAVGPDDVILAEILLTAGQSTITTANFLYDQVNRPGKRSSRVTLLTHANTPYTCTGTEDIVEVDCTLGAVTITLADPTDFPGQMTRFVKTDSSANSLFLTHSTQISGQTTQSLDDQWSPANIYSNGYSYRMV